jgi:hypothetical protein
MQGRLTHVSCVRCRAVHRFTGKLANSTHDLGHDSILDIKASSDRFDSFIRGRIKKTHLDIGQRHTDVRIVGLAEEEIPQPTRLGLGLKLLENRGRAGPS